MLSFGSPKNMLVFLMLTASLNAFAQSTVTIPTDNPLRNSVDSVAQKAAVAFMKNPGKVGLSVGLYYHGRFYKYNYGETAPGSGKLPASNSIYEIGSITKTFTGLLLAHAIADQKINLNDDIRKYLKGSYPNLQYANGSPVKVIYLATHIARFPRAFTKPVDSTFADSDFENELHAIKLDTLTPYRYNYSNLGYQLLGHLLENACGMSYEKLLEKYITGPLHMPQTRIDVSDGTLLRGYDIQHQPMPGTPAVYPGAGSIRSNIDDMLKYMDVQLKENDPVIRMTHRFIYNSAEGTNALPWAIGRNRDWDYYMREDGGTKGFRTFMTMFPDEQIGVILLSNETDDNAGRQLYDATNTIFQSLKGMK